MQGDIKKIQSQLNKLCSQHDQLMTLLDIYDYIPNLKHLQQINRTISSKINTFEHEIEELLQTNSTVKTREDIHLKMKQEEFKNNMETTQIQLADLNNKIEQHKAVIAELEEGHSSNLKILGLKEKTKTKINTMFEVFDNQMGDKLAEQVLRLKQNTAYSEGEGETAIERAISDENYNYEKIMHEVQLQLLQLQPPPFKEYFQFSYSQLKKEILLINSKAQNLQEFNISEVTQQERQLFEMKMGLLKRMCEQLQFRVIALKRHTGEQLMLGYEQCQDKMKVNQTEKRVKQKLRQLQHLITVLKGSTHLQNDY